MSDDRWIVIQREVAVRSEPAHWGPWEPYSSFHWDEPDDYLEKVRKIDWAMEHVIFGADDFWTEKGLKRNVFEGGIDHYQSASEMVADYALIEHGAYGFNMSHGAYLEEPVLVDFDCWVISEFVVYTIRHGFEFLDWLKETYGKEETIATVACLEMVLCELEREQDDGKEVYRCYVPSNYYSWGVFIWEQAASDYNEGKIPLESLSYRGPIETVDPSLVHGRPGPGILDTDGLRVIKRE